MYCDLLTIGPWGQPSPLIHVYVLNGWPLSFDIREVPRSLGKWNWHWLSFLPFIFFSIKNWSILNVVQNSSLWSYSCFEVFLLMIMQSMNFEFFLVQIIPDYVYFHMTWNLKLCWSTQDTWTWRIFNFLLDLPKLY